MNGIQAITAQIIADAQTEADRILAQARARAKECLSAYQEQAYIQSTALLERSERESALRGRTPLPCCNLSGAQFTAQYRAGNEGACLCRGIKATVGIAGRGIR